MIREIVAQLDNAVSTLQTLLSALKSSNHVYG